MSKAMPTPWRGVVGPSLLAAAVIAVVSGPGPVAAWAAGGAVVGIWAVLYDRCLCAGASPEGRALVTGGMNGACVGLLVAVGHGLIGPPMWWLLGVAAGTWIVLVTSDGHDGGHRRRHLRNVSGRIRHWPPTA